ncbi:coiled-coil domain-containing protein 42 like-2-like [Xyrichtys novacula]|uniref:Coiled-coil domain-containing protein 42 like-2-like n=1 Tax=Xyrichtys novacula TaxID=13765 RepID=A0AAV1GPU7_XYRNO|nr:coiled-coil domain-containing protein 42 like-2-like [Xyrichtys novacula]
MSRGIIREAKKDPQYDRAMAWVDYNQKSQENQKLNTQRQELEKLLESLKMGEAELQEEFNAMARIQAHEKEFKRKRDAENIVDKVERERQEKLQKEEEIKRLQEEYAKLLNKRQEQKKLVQEYAVYNDYMEKVLKLTQFKDVEQLYNNSDKLQNMKEENLQTLTEYSCKIVEKREAFQALKSQFEIEESKRSREKVQQKSKLEKAHAEYWEWKGRYSEIMQTATEETIELGSIMFSALTHYKLTDEYRGNMCDKNVGFTDAEKMFDIVKYFYLDYEEILRHYDRQKISHGGETAKTKA